MFVSYLRRVKSIYAKLFTWWKCADTILAENERMQEVELLEQPVGKRSYVVSRDIQ